MSRPPQYEPNIPMANRRSVIDFVGVPAPQPQYFAHEEFALQAGYPPQGPSPYFPAQSPASLQAQYAMQLQQYPQYQPNPYMQSAYTPIPVAPMQPPYMASAYLVQQPQDPALQYGAGVATQRSITEESLRDKINTKIESIMDSHRTELMSTQIENLTDKVQKLSRNIEAQSFTERAARSSSCPPGEAKSIASESPDEELSKRLRRLAAESSRRAAVSPGESIPTW